MINCIMLNIDKMDSGKPKTNISGKMLKKQNFVIPMKQETINVKI